MDESWRFATDVMEKINKILYPRWARVEGWSGMHFCEMRIKTNDSNDIVEAWLRLSAYLVGERISVPVQSDLAALAIAVPAICFEVSGAHCQKL